MIARSLAALALLALPHPAGAEEIAVLDRAVARGQQVAAADLVAERRDQVRGLLRLADAVGMEARRDLAAGSVLRASDLIAPQLVRRGEPVTVRIRAGGLSITTAGRALAGGGQGDPVRVVVTATSRTLDGIVEGAGSVRITAP